MTVFGMDSAAMETKHCTFTATEIHQQPNTWKKTIGQIEAMKDQIDAFIKKTTDEPDFDIILTGAGTSEFVGNALYSYLGKRLDYKVKSYGTTDLVATPANYLSKTKPTLLINFARSGNSPESVASVEVANEQCEHIHHLFITCNKNGALSKLAETHHNYFAIDLTDETNDQSFAMTSSYSNMYLACLLCFNLDRLDEMKKELEPVIASAEKMVSDDYTNLFNLVHDYDFKRIVYLGANTLKGTAQESALKMLELTAGKVVTMYDTPMGFRHGPKSIIDDSTLTVVYMSNNAYSRQYEYDIIKEMSAQRKGNRILAVSASYDEEIANMTDYFVSFNDETVSDNIFLGLDYILVAQIIAIAKSLSLNITPDNPCPTGEVNRVVKGVIIHPYTR